VSFSAVTALITKNKKLPTQFVVCLNLSQFENKRPELLLRFGDKGNSLNIAGCCVSRYLSQTATAYALSYGV
jgi:hypothetical protein